MSWKSDAVRWVKSVEEDAESFVPRRYAARVKMFLDRFLPYALLLMGSLFVLHFAVDVGSSMAGFISFLNWVMVFYFVLRLAMGFRLAESDSGFLRQHWFDALLVLPAFALVRELRFLSWVEGFSAEEAAGTEAARDAGLASQITRIIRIAKRSLSL
ncbi:MAG: hypothetical protein ABEJ95_06695 [Candidatus Nanohalobium sp.]